MNQNKTLQSMLNDKKVMQQVIQTREAQALMGMLQKSQSPASLQQAAQKAARGDTSELAALLQTLTNQPEGARLLQQLSSKLGK